MHLTPHEEHLFLCLRRTTQKNQSLAHAEGEKQSQIGCQAALQTRKGYSVPRSSLATSGP